MAMAYVLLIEHMIAYSKMVHQMQVTEKLTLVSALAASVAHEVRNPMTVVRGFLQLMQKTAQEAHSRHITIAIRELDRMEMIISDYLNFAHPEMEQVEVFDAKKLLDSVGVLMIPYAMMHNAKLVIRGEDYLLVLGDPDKLKQVLINLVKNALESGATEVLLVGTIQKSVIQLVVEDNGSGMNREELKRLGSPFYSTKANGTGLGLMVTFRIVRAMGGSLDFSSQQGAGTRAVMTFPCSE